LSRQSADASADESSSNDNFPLVDDNMPLLADLGLRVVNSFPESPKLLLLDRDVLGSLNNPLDWNSLNGSFRNDLRNVLLDMLDSIIVDLGNFTRNSLDPPALLVLSHHSLFRNSLDPLASLIVNHTLLEWNILDSGLS
jgi:hypothetical protein